ncbi:formyltransferase [Paludibacterium purpuratum]|uniref:Methionyl-tRNA formyltransferase n=1 Tax=Paludibacterium purpuratum TaxID=1144873 RepID=A0A4R7BFV0_9NEIS|nr:formyltransferase [Paludibacterium purpuratum]TDR82627.1 methionyl-tRNA formyltransferase [Paludibacterium purpuratum]
MTRVVVFAYHDVGVRCLKTLIGAGVDVALVITHRDNPNETIWFDSVAGVAAQYDIPTMTPDDPNSDDVVARVRALAPDFLFSFYYRKMLAAPLLSTASRGAYNMHGSLLPKYRGRVPINWAVIHGETETGATLHQMNVKPDNGPLVDQFAVPILPDDTAAEVFDKVVVAAEIVLARSLPRLIDGSAELTKQDLSLGAYFGGRGPEDGRIDGKLPARALHDFVRALSRPYPGAFADTSAGRLILWKTRVLQPAGSQPARPGASLSVDGAHLRLDCADGGVLRILDADLDEQTLDTARFAACFGERATLPL